jgi:hypothetical protein
MKNLMNLIVVLLALVSLSGCATWAGMSENEKKTAMWVTGIVLTAYIVSEADGDSSSTVIREEFCDSGHPVHGC